MIILSLHEIPDDEFNQIMTQDVHPEDLWNNLLEDIGRYEGLFIAYLDHDMKRAHERVHEFVTNYKACD